MTFPDGQRTGRYRWDQLFKTEKTHCGTLVEINLQREFEFANGDKLDYQIAGADVDCKFSQTFGGWMIPLEAHGEICMVVWASDDKALWSLGVVRASPDILTSGGNRDRKVNIAAAGRTKINWIFHDAPLL